LDTTFIEEFVDILWVLPDSSMTGYVKTYVIDVDTSRTPEPRGQSKGQFKGALCATPHACKMTILVRLMSLFPTDIRAHLMLVK
jgi:hypothetical protein